MLPVHEMIQMFKEKEKNKTEVASLANKEDINRLKSQKAQESPEAKLPQLQKLLPKIPQHVSTEAEILFKTGRKKTSDLIELSVKSLPSLTNTVQTASHESPDNQQLQTSDLQQK